MHLPNLISYNIPHLELLRNKCEIKRINLLYTLALLSLIIKLLLRKDTSNYLDMFKSMLFSSSMS